MLFVDGENLAIRYGVRLAELGQAKRSDVDYVTNVLVWSSNLIEAHVQHPMIMRRYYYTAVQGDDLKIDEVEAKLKALGFETPRVFKKEKGKGSKRVDITLATDMLLHAVRKHYDAAILVAGDEDYVPLVRAVQGEGARVYTWFLSNGMSPALLKCSDRHESLDIHLLEI